MRFSLLLFLILSTLTSCEDTKKTSDEKANKEVSVTKDSIQTASVKSEVISEEKKKYPVITNDNVVEFLTKYGEENPETKVKVKTPYGDIDLELYEDTPLHRANFIYLVKQNYFENTFFHRVVPNFIIQAGNGDHPTMPKKRRIIGKDYLIPAELSNGRKHRYGTVSGSKEYRENPDKRTAPFEFFIFLGEQIHTAHLNGNYTIFAKVTNGMKVVEEIANLPADKDDWPHQNIYITAEVYR